MWGNWYIGILFAAIFSFTLYIKFLFIFSLKVAVRYICNILTKCYKMQLSFMSDIAIRENSFFQFASLSQLIYEWNLISQVMLVFGFEVRRVNSRREFFGSLRIEKFERAPTIGS